ncbi:hypothetical protein MY1884_008640 [Beauveria asiatica]
MSLQPYLHLIKSQADFKKNFVDEKAPLFAKLKNEPASKWGRQELFACRVLPKQGNHNLPCLKPFITEKFTTAQMTAFVDGPEDPADLGGSELALVRKYGHSLGQLWAALAAFTGPPERREPFSPPDEGPGGGDDGNNDDDGNNNGGGGDDARWPKRARRSTRQQGFVDSSTLKFESNSPIASSQGSQGSLGYVDAESHALAAGPEDDTLRLITCALRHVLYFAPPNNEPNAAAAVVEVRDAKIRLENNIGLRSLVAVDDGGLCLREPQIFEHRRSDGSLCQRTVYTTANNHVLMLETKRMLQCLPQGVPIISDACLAQMTCQALSCRMDNSGRDSVIILHAAQNYVCFVQFDMSTNYLLGLSSETPTEFLHF